MDDKPPAEFSGLHPKISVNVNICSALNIMTYVAGSSLSLYYNVTDKLNQIIYKLC